MTVIEVRSREPLYGGPHMHAALLGTLYAMPEPPKGTRPPPVERTEAEEADLAPQRVVVLIAEDEETIAETLAMLIEDAGHVPVVARDGREALSLAREHRPQLIITDLMMPYLTGADLIAAVRRDAAVRGAATPRVVVITAASRAHAEEAGADVIILKPFDLTKIEAAIQRLLGGDVH